MPGSVLPLCSVFLRPDLQHAFAHRGSLPMGRVLACIGPWAPAPVWSGCTCMCVVFPAPCSSVRGLLTACPVTTAVYFTSVCTNWTLITRFLQLGQIRPQLRHSAAHGEAPEPGTREDIGSWWIKTPSDPAPIPTLPSTHLLLQKAGWLRAIPRLHNKAACNYAVRGLSSLARIIGLSVTFSIRNKSLRSRQSGVGGYLDFTKVQATQVVLIEGSCNPSYFLISTSIPLWLCIY